MFDKIAHLEGDIVECGVGYGKTFEILALLSKPLNKQLWGFDSFEGFPEPSREDISGRNAQKGEWNVSDVEEVYEKLKVAHMPPDYIEHKIKIVKGFFPDTLPKTNIKRIAMLHLDVDLYQSHKDCLTYLFPKIVNGGIVLFDEYANKIDLKKFPGAKKAIDEYFAGKHVKIIHDTDFGKFYVIKD